MAEEHTSVLNDLERKHTEFTDTLWASCSTLGLADDVRIAAEREDGVAVALSADLRIDCPQTGELSKQWAVWLARVNGCWVVIAF